MEDKYYFIGYRFIPVDVSLPEINGHAVISENPVTTWARTLEEVMTKGAWSSDKLHITCALEISLEEYEAAKKYNPAYKEHSLHFLERDRPEK